MRSRWLIVLVVAMGFSLAGVWLWSAGSLLVLPAFAALVITWIVGIGLFALKALLVDRLLPALEIAARLGRTAWDSTTSDSDGQKIRATFEQLAGRFNWLRAPAGWLADRFRPGRGGLRRTVPAGVAVLSGLALFRLGRLVGDATSVVVGTDERIADMADRLNGSSDRILMLGLTSAGRTSIMVAIIALLAVAAYVAGARRSSVLLVAITATSALAVTVLKATVARSRPGLGLLVETSSSWPSGHASAGVALALAVVIAWHAAGRSRWPLVAAFVIPVGVLIGYSRAYLSVHWASDVVGGWLVATTATGLVMVLDDVLYRRREPAADWTVARWLPMAFVAAAAVFVGAAYIGRSVQLPILPQRHVVELSTNDPTEALVGRSMSSETLIGDAIEPVSVVIAASQDVVLAAVKDAGWSLADDPTVQRVLEVYRAGIRGGDDLTAPVTPTFLDGRMHDLAIEKPTGSSVGSARERHHARLWLLDTETASGCSLWLVTASLDERAQWTWRTILPNHHIAPAIDEERAFLVNDLTSTGLVDVVGSAVTTGPTLGTNAAGDPWFTDGSAAVLAAPECSV